MLGTIQGAMVRAVPPASMVWPSGSARTTALPAIVPPAPPRFSTTIGWPSLAASGSNTARGTRSVALPAAKGMKARNGLAGQVCAAATAVEAIHVARIASAIRILRVIMSPIMLLHARGSYSSLGPLALLISKQSRQCRSIIACGRRGVYPAVFHRTGLLDISLRSMRRRKLSSECRIRDNGLARSMKRFFTRLQADLTFLRGVWRVLRLTSPIARNPTRIFPLLVDDLAVRHGDKLALVSNRERLTYRMLAARSCRYARWAIAQGVGKGDVVALP